MGQKYITSYANVLRWYVPLVSFVGVVASPTHPHLPLLLRAIFCPTHGYLLLFFIIC